jgi:hypothetical protein
LWFATPAINTAADGVQIPVLLSSSISDTLSDSLLVGDGTFGAVYSLESSPNLVIKVFKPACDDDTRLNEVLCLGYGGRGIPIY